MGLQEARNACVDPELIRAMRREWGLPQETLGILDTVDLKSGKNDALLLGSLENDVIDIQTKVKIIHRLYEAIFEDDESDRYDQNRVGRYLNTTTKLYKDKNVPDQLKASLYNYISPLLLEDVARESSSYRWTADNTEATLYAYCTFQTIGRKHKDKEAKDIYQKIAKELVYAREFDLMLEKAGEVVSNEGRGTGPILVVHEEPQLQGFGNQIVSMLARKDSELHEVVKNRDIYLIGSKDVPVPPCDGILMNSVISRAQGIQDFIFGLYHLK